MANQELSTLGEVIKGALLGLPDTNLMTDAEKLKLDNLASGDSNYIDPHDFGAKGDGIGYHDGQVTGGSFNIFKSASHLFANSEIGNPLWFDPTKRIIDSVNSDGSCVFSPAHTGLVSNTYWLSGSDDTAAIQAALDYARSLQGSDIAETAGGTNGVLKMGGIVRLRPATIYIISNSQASYNAGNLSALKVYRRTGLVGSGFPGYNSQLAFAPGSYGHMIANASPNGLTNAFSDFLHIGNLWLHGYSDWNPNALDGIFLYVAFDGYDKVDPFNRVFNVNVNRIKRNGFYFRGRGELIVENCVSTNSGNYGYFFESQADYKVINCNSSGSGKTGVRIYSSGAGHFESCKSFYSGVGGGSVAEDCANWVIDADQMRNGLTYFVDCEAQESRGSGWLIKSGLNIFNGCTGLDPGRLGLNSGTLPAVVACFALTGQGCRQNTFNNCYGGPSVAIFNMTNNFGLATDAVFIDGVDSFGAGPQANRGNINTFVSTTNSDGSIDPGTNYRAGYGPIGGGGKSNGRNVQLSINGTRLEPVAPLVPTNVVATAKDSAADITWKAPFDGGSATTDYLIEYKEATSSTWLTFSHTPLTTPEIIVTGLTNGTAYNFRVTAINAKGSSPVSATATTTPFVSVPGQPTGLTATPGPDSAVLTWTAPASDGNNAITDYLVLYKESTSSTWLTFSDGTTPVTGTTVTGLLGNIAYDFSVSAINAIGTGAASSTASATPTVWTIGSFAPSVWHDFSDTASINATGSDTDSVLDKSGNNRTSYGSGSTRPKTGTRTINGLNALDFTNQNLSMDALLYPLSQGANTIIAVIKTDITTGGNQFAVSNNGNHWCIGVNGGSNLLVGANHPSTILTKTLSPALNTSAHVIIMRRNGNSVTINYGSQVLNNAAAGANTTTTSLTIGSGFDGLLGEVAIAPNAWTDTQVAIALAGLNRKWNAS